jgi:16S rRNA (uracil1498-N3)-methyltransferase
MKHWFYWPQNLNEGLFIDLPQDQAKHATQVLRLKVGDTCVVINGQGAKAIATFKQIDKKQTTLVINEVMQQQVYSKQITIAISPLKNPSRLEWFLEKATEIGIAGIIPIICKRTEKWQVKQERWQQILISATLQSQQLFLPKLYPALNFEEALTMPFANKYLAHCLPSTQKIFLNTINVSEAIIFIGPEGDFTEEEIALAMQQNITPVSLGQTRLRTETAGIAAALFLTKAHEPT